MWISFLCFKKKHKNSKTYSFYCISSLLYPWHYWYLCRNVWEDYVTKLGERKRDRWLELLNPSFQGLILRVHSSICCRISSYFCNKCADPSSCSIVDCESTRNKIDLQPEFERKRVSLFPSAFFPTVILIEVIGCNCSRFKTELLFFLEGIYWNWTLTKFEYQFMKLSNNSFCTASLLDSQFGKILNYIIFFFFWPVHLWQNVVCSGTWLFPSVVWHSF